MEETNTPITKAKRYTQEEKEAILTFIENFQGRGAQKAAVAQFGVSAVTISHWIKASKSKKRTRTSSAKSSKKSINIVDPEDLRRLASLMEEISQLETLVAKLDTLREEADAIREKFLS
jgi:transposase-like protein